MTELLKADCNIVERFFDETSLTVDEAPKLIVLFGCVASGKTTMRRSRYSSGFVILDAAELSMALGYGANDEFPPTDPTRVHLAGRAVARRAVRERRNLVIELVSNFAHQLQEVLAVAQWLGYVPSLLSSIVPPTRQSAEMPKERPMRFRPITHSIFMPLGSSMSEPEFSSTSREVQSY